MQKLTLFFGVLLLGLLHGCQKPQLIPIKGSIEGFVIDNNGAPIKDADIAIIYVPATEEAEEAEEKEVTIHSNVEGFYELGNLWDDLLITVSKTGFKGAFAHIRLSEQSAAIHDFELIGSPTVQSITLTTNNLTAADENPIQINVALEDGYNSDTPKYEGNLFFEDANGVLQLTLPLNPLAIGATTATLTAKLTHEQLLPGTYTISTQVIDLDGNKHFLKTSTSLRIE